MKRLLLTLCLLTALAGAQSYYWFPLPAGNRTFGGRTTISLTDSTWLWVPRWYVDSLFAHVGPDDSVRVAGNAWTLTGLDTTDIWGRISDSVMAHPGSVDTIKRGYGLQARGTYTHAGESLALDTSLTFPHAVDQTARDTANRALAGPDTVGTRTWGDNIWLGLTGKAADASGADSTSLADSAKIAANSWALNGVDTGDIFQRISDSLAAHPSSPADSTWLWASVDSLTGHQATLIDTETNHLSTGWPPLNYSQLRQTFAVNPDSDAHSSSYYGRKATISAISGSTRPIGNMLGDGLSVGVTDSSVISTALTGSLCEIANSGTVHDIKTSFLSSNNYGTVSNYLYGLEASVSNMAIAHGAGDMSTANGIAVRARTQNSTVNGTYVTGPAVMDEARCVHANITNSHTGSPYGAKIGRATGFDYSLSNGAGDSITTSYGLRFSGPTNSGYIGSHYGIYLGDQTVAGASPNYAIYSAGGPNYLADYLTVEDSVISAKFIGPLTGNVTGDVSGSSGSCTGQAATVATIAGLTADNSAALQGKDTNTVHVYVGRDSAGTQKGDSGLFKKCILGDGTQARQLIINGGGPTSTGADLYILKSASYPYMQFINTKSGGAVTDGFKIGVEDSLYGGIVMKENWPIVISTNNTERVRIAAGGGMAIDSTGLRPGKELFVKGDIAASGHGSVDSTFTAGTFLVGDTVIIRTGAAAAAFAATVRFTTYVDSSQAVDTINLAALNASGARARVLCLYDSVFVKNGATGIDTLTVGKWADYEYLGAPCSRWAKFGTNR